MNDSEDLGDAVCEGCLSQEREIITEITEYDVKKLFYEIISIRDADIVSLSLRLCAVCKDSIVKFLEFRRLVLEARDTVNKYLFQSEINAVKTENVPTSRTTEVKSDPEELVTALPFVKVEIDGEHHFLDDDSREAEDLKPALDTSLKKKNKVRSKSKKRSEDEFNDSDEEPLHKKKTQEDAGVKKEKRKGRRERPAGVVDNSRVRRKLQQLNVDAGLVAMEILSWEQVAAERAAAARSARYLRSVWRCAHCVLGFNHRAKLDNHMKKHDPSAGGHECGVCTVRCKDAHSLSAHTRRHRVRMFHNAMISATLVLLLPVLTRALIEVNITGSEEPSQQNLVVSGTNEAVITDLETQSFQLTDENVKNAVKNHFGAQPDDVFLKSPTPWGDLYVIHKWKQVSKVLTPVSAKILSVKFRPFLVFSQTFNNTSSKPAIYKARIWQNVEDTVASVWEKFTEISASNDIKYGFDVKAMGVSGKAAFSFYSKWGENVLKFQTVTVGSQTGLDISLQPKQSVIAELIATKGTMKMQINYIASLTGTVAVNYENLYKGHHFWSVDVNKVLDAGGLNKTVLSTEIIDFAFYVKSRVDLRDFDTNDTLASVPLYVF